ncbi:MAG: hypothetical protein RJA70_2036 [Pseudomonadota bacterium]
MQPQRLVGRLGRATPGVPATTRSDPAGISSDEDVHSWRGSGLILVVDDEPAVARVTEMVLDQCGFSVNVATSGVEALRHMERFRDQLRLVLIDLTMPDQSGIEVMQAARRLGLAVPMVLTSGYPNDEADKRFEGDGFSGYLQKPYRLEVLMTVLRRALGE